MVFVILQITNNVKLKAMKNVLLILTLCVGMVACSGGKTKSVAENQQTKKDVVEVLYFHGAQRCATCMAIEKNTIEVVETRFAEQLNNEKLIFRTVDIDKEKEFAERYEVSWSSLILVDYDKSGKESATNLTEFAFGSARTAPDKFKQGLSARITEMLNN